MSIAEIFQAGDGLYTFHTEIFSFCSWTYQVQNWEDLNLKSWNAYYDQSWNLESKPIIADCYVFSKKNIFSLFLVLSWPQVIFKVCGSGLVLETNKYYVYSTFFNMKITIAFMHSKILFEDLLAYRYTYCICTYLLLHQSS